MGKFLEKYGDYVFSIFFLLISLVLFIFHCAKLSKCTTWDNAAFKNLAGCIDYGWITIIWILNLKQKTDVKKFNEIKKLLEERR